MEAVTWGTGRCPRRSDPFRFTRWSSVSASSLAAAGLRGFIAQEAERLEEQGSDGSLLKKQRNHGFLRKQDAC
jgi:hypothetical protein